MRGCMSNQSYASLGQVNIQINVRVHRGPRTPIQELKFHTTRSIFATNLIYFISIHINLTGLLLFFFSINSIPVRQMLND